MTPLEFIDRIYTPDLRMPEGEHLTIEIIVNGRRVLDDVLWCAYMASVASLSGWLDDVDRDDAMGALEAAVHGKSLHVAGVLTDEQVEREVYDLMRQVQTEGPKAQRVVANRRAVAGYDYPN